MPENTPITGMPSEKSLVPPPLKSSLVKTPSEVTEGIEANYTNLPETEEFELNLASYVKACWVKAKQYKQAFETQLLANKRQIEGIYETEKLDAIRNVGGSEVYMLLTATKTRAAKAWVEEVLFQPGAKPWAIESTPLPDLPDEIRATMLEEILSTYLDGMLSLSQQNPDIDPANLHQELTDRLPEVEKELKSFLLEKAKETAEQMQVKIDDQLTEGGWYDALYDSIPDIVLGTGIIKGPIYKKRKTRKPVSDPVTNRITIVEEEEIIPYYESRSPFNVYPAPGSSHPNDGYLFDRITMTARKLQNLIGVPGFSETEIRAVLSEYDEGSISNWLDTDIDSNLEEISSDTPGSSATVDSDGSGSNIRVYDSDKIECLELWGAIQGKMLQDWGMSTTDIPDSELFYDVVVWQIDNHVIKAMLNDDVNGDKPFNKASFIDRKDCFWGQGLPETITDVAQSCNACARAIVNNVGMASGPMAERNIDRIPRDEIEDNTIIPWKVWDVTDEQMSTAPAIKFYSPPLVAERILSVFTYFSNLADEHCGVPAYAHGDMNVGGAGRALADYEKVLTPDGSINISLLDEGDEVVNTYGSFSKVTGVYPQGESDIVRVNFSNGKHVDCDMEHRWSVRTHGDRNFRTLTTKEILNKGLFQIKKKNYRCPSGLRPKWMIPLLDYIEFEERPVKIDPYTMGALLGNGDARCRITDSDQELFDRIPYPLGKKDRKPGNKSWAHTIMGIKEDYLSYGLKCKSVEKFIPKDYLFNSRDVRLELLRGLMDTDGCCSKEGGTDYSTSSFQMSIDFRSLIESLGGTVNKIYETDGGEFEVKGRKATRKNGYRIKFNLPGERLFYVQRKHERTFDRKKTHTYITGIEYIGKYNATCITVDSKNSLFVCENFIPTHNTASGLSMLMTGATRGIRSLIKSIDRNIIVPTVKAQYYQNIEQKENYGLVCDYAIVARGSDVLIAKQQQAIRRMEFAQALANPVDIKLTGEDGRRYMLKEVAKSLDMDADKVFPEQQGGNGQGQAGAQEMPAGMEGMMEGGANMGGGGQGSSPTTLDAAGNPAQGADFREFTGAGGSPKRYV